MKNKCEQIDPQKVDTSKIEIIVKTKNPDSFESGFCTSGGTWTRTDIAAHRILSPACLPIPPSRQTFRSKTIASFGFRTSVNKKATPKRGYFSERKTGLEPATSTLARSRSTNWATFAFPIFSEGDANVGQDSFTAKKN